MVCAIYSLGAVTILSLRPDQLQVELFLMLVPVPVLVAVNILLNLVNLDSGIISKVLAILAYFPPVRDRCIPFYKF